jgi:hypothetical protein
LPAPGAGQLSGTTLAFSVTTNTLWLICGHRNRVYRVSVLYESYTPDHDFLTLPSAGVGALLA